MSIHFYVQRSTSFSEANTAITWESSQLNDGNAMSLSSGVFTALVPGIYQFTFSGLKDRTSTSLDISLRLNSNGNLKFIGVAMTRAGGATGTFDVVSLSASLRLRRNDRVYLYNFHTSGVEGGILHDSGNHHSHFSGWLVEEDLI